MSFSENLVRLQNERGETNYKLAKALGVSQSSIQNWREGKNMPHKIFLGLLAAHYGTTVDELLSGE